MKQRLIEEFKGWTADYIAGLVTGGFVGFIIGLTVATIVIYSYGG